MASYDRELMIFDMELNRNLQKIFKTNRRRTHLSHQKYIKKLRSQAKNGNYLGTEYMDLDNSQSDLQYNGMDMHSDGKMILSPSGYADMDMSNFSFTFDSNVGVNPRRDDLDTQRNQSLDDFFQDFNEIISSEMKAPTTPCNLATNVIPYNDQSNGFNSTISGVDFNLDMTQFYINTNESDFLNSDDIKTDFSNGLIHYPPPVPYVYQDDNPEFSVIDLSTADIKRKVDVDEHNLTTDHKGQQPSDDQREFAVLDLSNQQRKQVEDYSDTKISVSTPLNHFYLDFKMNGEAANATNVDNSVVTYISKDALQSVEYINESGQTETVMYVDQQPNIGVQDENSGGGITQYEIIDFDDYQYQTENIDSQQRTNNSVQYYGGDSQDVVVQQTDILTTLLSDRSNKVTMISKPMINPKARRQSTDEFKLKMEEIDSNPINIVFAKRPRVKGGRKQKLETINQTDLVVVETKRNRSKAKKTTIPTITAMATTAAAAATAVEAVAAPAGAPVTTKTVIRERKIPETPKLPSKFMRDRRNKMQVRRKRPRKLFWDSESDCENGEQFIDVSNN